jgi:hypothetical protein
MSSLLIMFLFQNYAGDKEMLGECEQVLSDAMVLNKFKCYSFISDKHIICYAFQFFLELMKVPRVESKLRVFAFKITFSSQVYFSPICVQYLFLRANALITVSAYTLVFAQVNDLRKNLNTINDAAREVILNLMVFKLLFMKKCLPYMHLKYNTPLTGKRICEITPDNADNSDFWEMP